MNKNDLKLIGIILMCAIICLITLKLIAPKSSVQASVYYENKCILKIDLRLDNSYQVEGKEGIVTLEVKDKKIRVVSENSPLHLCSKQGYISTPYESIVCLPNRITVTIDGNDDLDTIVK